MNLKINISKENIFLIFILYIIPVFDTFGLLVNNYFPVLIVSRSLTFALACLIVFNSSQVQKGVKLLLVIYIIYTLFSICIHSSLVNVDAFAMEISTFIKLLYFPMSFLSLYVLFKDERIVLADMVNVIFRYALLIFSSLIIGVITGYGGEITGRGADIEASKGFMIGANEVGLMLLLSIPFFIKRLSRFISFFKSNLVGLALYSISGIIVFTKSSLIAVVVALLIFLNNLNQFSRNKRIILKSLIFSILAGLVLYAYRKLSEVVDFMTSTFFATLLEGDFVSFLFRGRQNYIDAIFPQLYENCNNWLFFLFGVGEYYIRKISEVPLSLKAGQGSLFEMDFLDLFAMQGVIGFILFITLLYYIIRLSKVTKQRMHLFIISLTFLHSFMAGHVIFSPQVTSLISFILIISLIKNKNDLISCN